MNIHVDIPKLIASFLPCEVCDGRGIRHDRLNQEIEVRHNGQWRKAVIAKKYLEVGDRVEALELVEDADDGNRHWFGAIIKADNGDNTYKIMYECPRLDGTYARHPRKPTRDIRISDKYITLRLLDEGSQEVTGRCISMTSDGSFRDDKDKYYYGINAHILSQFHRHDVTVPLDKTRIALDHPGYMYRAKFLEGPLMDERIWVDKEDIQPTFKLITPDTENEYRSMRAVVEADRCELGSKISIYFTRKCPGCGMQSRNWARILPEKDAAVAEIRELCERIQNGECARGAGHRVISGYYCNNCECFRRYDSEDDAPAECEQCGEVRIWGQPPACSEEAVTDNWTAATNVKCRETVLLMPCQHKNDPQSLYEQSYLGLGNFFQRCRKCSQDGITIQAFFKQQLTQALAQGPVPLPPINP